MLGRKGMSFIMNAIAESSLCHPYSAAELLREELRTVLHREKDKNRVSDACIPCRTPGNRIVIPPSTVFQSMRGKYAWMWTREIFPHQEKHSFPLIPRPILDLSCSIFPLPVDKSNSLEYHSSAFTATTPFVVLLNDGAVIPLSYILRKPQNSLAAPSWE